MTHTALLALGVATLLVAAASMTLKATTKTGAIRTRPKKLMTKREQGMYWRLRETFPDAVVLGQVAFSALITSAPRDRNRYSQKIADFVVCDRAVGVQFIVELDDASHQGRAREDAARAALLTNAGYRVLRFANIPDKAALIDAIGAKS